MALSVALALAVRLAPRAFKKMGWTGSATSLLSDQSHTYVVRFLFPFGCRSTSPGGCDETGGVGVSDTLSTGSSEFSG